jgi:hypothetical protein
VTISAWFYKSSVDGGTPSIYTRFSGGPADYFTVSNVTANSDEWVRGIRTSTLSYKGFKLTINSIMVQSEAYITY